MTRSKCKNCYGKGYATIYQTIHYAADFIGDEAFDTSHIYKRYCVCRKGKGLKKAAQRRGDKREEFNLFLDK